MIKEILVSIVLVFGYQNLSAHGGHMASYKYQIEPTTIILEVQIESSVLAHFDLEKTCPTYESTTAFCLAQYINSKNILNINSTDIRFEMQSSRQDEDFFIITLRAKGDFSNCENITLKNECFLEFDRKFENRIIIQKQDSIKSYLLNRKNKNITVG